MSELIANEQSHRTRVISEDGKLYVHTKFNNQHAEEVNKQIRSSRMLEKMKLNLHDGEDVRGVLSIPSAIEYHIFKKKYPDIWRGLKSRDEADRMKALRRIQIMEPTWVLMERF